MPRVATESLIREICRNWLCMVELTGSEVTAWVTVTVPPLLIQYFVQIQLLTTAIPS